MLLPLLICAAGAWLVLNLLVLALCRLMARAEDVHLGLLARLCLDAEGAHRRPAAQSWSRTRRPQRGTRCRRDVSPAPSHARQRGPAANG